MIYREKSQTDMHISGKNISKWKETKKKKKKTSQHPQSELRSSLPTLSCHPQESESSNLDGDDFFPARNDESTQKCSGACRDNSLLAGAGGANPGMSLMSLLLGLTTWKFIDSKQKMLNCHCRKLCCDLMWVNTFTTMMAITPQTIRNRNSIMHLSVATWGERERL